MKESSSRKPADYMVKTCDDIMGGKVKPRRLVVSKVPRKPVNEYRSMFPHVVAAMQLAQKGKRLRRGEAIDFIYVNASHTTPNPFRRVVPALLSNKGNIMTEKSTLRWFLILLRQF